MKTII